MHSLSILCYVYFREINAVDEKFSRDERVEPPLRLCEEICVQGCGVADLAIWFPRVGLWAESFPAHQEFHKAPLVPLSAVPLYGLHDECILVVAACVCLERD